MASVNCVILIGNAGQDAELKHLNGETVVCNFTLATNKESKNKDTGEKTKRTTWHNITAFNKTAENMAKMIKKGSQVYIEGEINNRSWLKPNGETAYKTDILAHQFQMLGGHKQQETNEEQMDGTFDPSMVEENN